MLVMGNLHCKGALRQETGGLSQNRRCAQLDASGVQGRILASCGCADHRLDRNYPWDKCPLSSRGSSWCEAWQVGRGLGGRHGSGFDDFPSISCWVAWCFARFRVPKEREVLRACPSRQQLAASS
jgi:hypothetical protein